MMNIVSALSLIIVPMVLASAAPPARAKQSCSPREQAMEHLYRDHREHDIGRGITPNGSAMYELFVSETGTWSVLASDAHGRSCVMANGDGWQQMPLSIADPS